MNKAQRLIKIIESSYMDYEFTSRVPLKVFKAWFEKNKNNKDYTIAHNEYTMGLYHIFGADGLAATYDPDWTTLYSTNKDFIEVVLNTHESLSEGNSTISDYLASGGPDTTENRGHVFLF